MAGCTAAEPPAAETTAEETTAEASALTVPGSVEAEPAAYLDCDFSDHVDSALEAVWQVKAGLSNGTAFHIGGGQWLTAEHVISGRSTVTLHNSGASITATVEAANRVGDTALLLTSSAPSLLGFGSLSETGPGHQAYAVGFPLYDAPQASVSRGIVSRIERHAGLEDVILTDAAVNPGNSGGPLLNECGQVIGMNVSRLTEDDAVGLNYAVAEPTLRTRVAELGASIASDAPSATTLRATPTTTRHTVPATTTSPPSTGFTTGVEPIPFEHPDGLLTGLMLPSPDGLAFSVGSFCQGYDLLVAVTFAQPVGADTVRKGTSTLLHLSLDSPERQHAVVLAAEAEVTSNSSQVLVASVTSSNIGELLGGLWDGIPLIARTSIDGVTYSATFRSLPAAPDLPDCPRRSPASTAAPVPATSTDGCPGVSKERFDRLDQMEAQYLAEMDERIAAASPGSAAHTRLIAARADLAANLAIQRMELWAEHDAYLQACRASPG